MKLQPIRSSTHSQMKSNDLSSVPTQTYFKGHNDDIMCLAISPCRLFVATGQTASKSSKVKIIICLDLLIKIFSTRKRQF